MLIIPTIHPNFVSPVHKLMSSNLSEIIYKHFFPNITLSFMMEKGLKSQALFFYHDSFILEASLAFLRLFSQS